MSLLVVSEYTLRLNSIVVEYFSMTRSERSPLTNALTSFLLKSAVLYLYPSDSRLRIISVIPIIAHLIQKKR